MEGPLTPDCGGMPVPNAAAFRTAKRPATGLGFPGGAFDPCVCHRIRPAGDRKGSRRRLGGEPRSQKALTPPAPSLGYGRPRAPYDSIEGSRFIWCINSTVHHVQAASAPNRLRLTDLS